MLDSFNKLHTNHSFLKYLFKNYKTETITTLILSIFVSFTEGLALIILLPLLEIAGVDTSSGKTADLVEQIKNIFSTQGLTFSITSTLTVFIFISLTNEFLYSLRAEKNETLYQKIQLNLRKKLYIAATESKWSYFLSKNKQKLQHYIVNEIPNISLLLQTLVNIFVDVSIILVYLAIALFISFKLTLLIMTMSLILSVIFIPRLQKSKALGKLCVLETENLSLITAEDFRGAKEARIYNNQDINLKKYTSSIQQIAKYYINFTKLQSNAKVFYQAGGSITLSAILYYSIVYLKLSPSDLLFMIILFYRVMPKFAKLQFLYVKFFRLLPSFEKITHEINLFEKYQKEIADISKKIIFKNNIQFDNVSLTQNHSLLFKNCNIEILPGKIIGLTGDSGAGKSCLIDLLLGLKKPTTGEILVDKQKLNQVSTSNWGSNISYVGQKAFLLNNTIRDNFKWVRDKITDEEIWEALKIANVSNFVAKLQKQIDTKIGEEGIQISGGEYKRIAIACALARDSKLLILDEATNSLDKKNEKEILDNISKTINDKSIFIVSHKLSTIKYCDLIYKIESQCIIDYGSWNNFKNTININTLSL